MAKRKVIWSADSSLDMIEIMEFYNNKNKSKTYSSKLYKEINLKLKTLNFSVALPKKTSDKKLFYFSTIFLILSKTESSSIRFILETKYFFNAIAVITITFIYKTTYYFLDLYLFLN